jgi:hypothetical protein
MQSQLRVGDVVRAGDDFVATVLMLLPDGRVIAERRECGILVRNLEVVERSTVLMRLALRVRDFALSVREGGLSNAIYCALVPER